MLLSAMRPDPNNERDHSRGIEELMASIRDAGFVGTIALRSHEDPTVVAGHGRLEALKRLGWTELPDDHIEYLDHLTDEEVARFRLNDNKTSDLSRWNKAKLTQSVKRLERQGFDMAKFGFDFKSKTLPYGAERLKTDRAYNLGLVNIDDCSGKFGMPTLEAVDFTPTKLLPFNYAKTAEDKKQTLHFFIDDYQFERLWNNPKSYLDLIKSYEAVLTSDFSLYMDMPLPMQQWNEYRRRALGHWWQKQGITVIPTLSWTNELSYGFCFEGLPHKGTVAVSTVGIKGDKGAEKIWREGMKRALEVVRPSRVLFYGKGIGKH